MTQDTPAFFALDHGTASVRAALIAPVAGRYRLLAAGAAPTGIDPGTVLEDLAWRVARTDATVAGSMEGWREWSRLEVRSMRAPRAVLVAASEGTGSLLERAFVGAGWRVMARFYGPEPDLISLGDACLDPRADAVVTGGRDGVEEAELMSAHRLWPRTGSLARFRDDLAVIACGPFAERPEGIPDGRLFSLPAPEAVPATTESLLRTAAQQVGLHLVTRGHPAPADARAATRAAIASLAAVLGQRVDGIDVGMEAASRTIAGPGGDERHAVIADACLLPARLLEDDAVGEAVLRWSTLPGDPASRLDALRELGLQPWAHPDDEGAHLRAAALRGALQRLTDAWDGAPAGGVADGAELMVLGGGVIASLPPPVAAMAAIDAVRRPGAVGIVHDHAGILAPLGALPVEQDRQRLLVDLLEDCLLPLGSALLTGPFGRSGRKAPAAIGLRVSSALGEQELRLEPGQLHLVDLPPGVAARVELDPGEGAVLGQEGRHTSLEVRGGLGGLLVDTRDIPLSLPDGGEQRRATLAAWESAAWLGSEA